jgi:hypothetical protein
LQVNTIRPATTALLIDHHPLENLIKSSSFNPISRVDDLCFEAEDAKAYYFEADGNGTAFLEKYDNTSKSWTKFAGEELRSNRKYKAYSNLISVEGRVRIRFTGEFFYSVRNVALYKHLYSNNRDDIPSYEPYTRYDMHKLTDDFLTFNDPPVVVSDEYAQLNQGYEIESNSILLLPYNKAGAYKVIYKRRPHPIQNSGMNATDETRIDLDEELCYLLPNLVAAYIWAEDEPSLSEYYLSLYRERAAEIVSTTKNTAPVIYKSCNGW